MDLYYYKAGAQDIEILTETRIAVLRAANLLDGDVDMSLVRRESEEYYLQTIK